MISARVVNASPLIFLTRVGLLEVLRDGDRPVFVPEEVLLELRGHGGADPAVAAVERAEWIDIIGPIEIPQPIADWRLGVGESAVLAKAITVPESIAVLDDLAARNCARSLGLALQGTAGLLVAAKRSGLVAEVGPILDRLLDSGMYLSDRLRRMILHSAEESP